jgi:hypothetical protein
MLNKNKCNIFIWSNNNKIKKTLMNYFDNIFDELILRKNIEYFMVNNNIVDDNKIIDKKIIEIETSGDLINKLNLLNNNKTDYINLLINFIIYFNNKNNEEIPNLFIKEYNLFTYGKYISVSEFINWLDISRNTFIETLLAKFKKNYDYFIVNYEDEMKELKFTEQFTYKKKINQKYYIITTNCFREYCSRSLTIKGNLLIKIKIKFQCFKTFLLVF